LENLRLAYQNAARGQPPVAVCFLPSHPFPTAAASMIRCLAVSRFLRFFVVSVLLYSPYPLLPYPLSPSSYSRRLAEYFLRTLVLTKVLCYN
jgi:hypothetical protein